MVLTELSTVHEEEVVAGEYQDLRLQFLRHDGVCTDVCHITAASQSVCINPREILLVEQRNCFPRRLEVMKGRE